MAAFAYRAATSAGDLRSGELESGSRAEALERLVRMGLTPIEARPVSRSGSRPAPHAAGGARRAKADAATRRASINVLGELAVLLGSGLSLDRALAICVDNAARPPLRAALAELAKAVKEGAPLSQGFARSGGLFPPMAAAMAEAGEANGRLDVALGRLADGLDRAETLRRTVSSALVYPAMLLALAGGVILLMMLFVVPQFEGLFADQQAKLPTATKLVLAASHLTRSYGLAVAAGLVAAGALGTRMLRRPATRAAFDRLLLRLPQVGELVKAAETARFARVLGSLVDGGVHLPAALAIAGRALGVAPMRDAVVKVATELKEGGGLSGPLAATGLFPKVALSFLRTGEETARLGLMLDRLADLLDRDVREALQRLLTLLTPVITVGMGALVAGVIASILSAILGFNDLALSS